jgi:hypothetical protein
MDIPIVLVIYMIGLILLLVLLPYLNGYKWESPFKKDEQRQPEENKKQSQ